MNNIYEQVQQIIDPVYLVGGPVRDELLGKEPKDYDFTTPLSPNEIEAKVRAAGRRPYLVGKRFGTIGFKIGGLYVEVTTHRSESYQTGSRKPEVQFIDDITQDLSRRDFTINAMAKRGKRVIDPFNGQDDLNFGIIRAVGSAKLRFKEDPLRMLRAARFRAQLGFAVDGDTGMAAYKMSHKILEVSKERWVQELDKLLTAEKPSLGLGFLADTRLLNFMLPELAIQVGYDQNSPYHELTLWHHTMSTVDLAPNDVDLRWAALLHDVAKPYVRTNKPDGKQSNYIMHDLLGAEVARKIGTDLKWSKYRAEYVSNIILHHLEDNSPIRAADNASKSKLPS